MWTTHTDRSYSSWGQVVTTQFFTRWAGVIGGLTQHNDLMTQNECACLIIFSGGSRTGARLVPAEHGSNVDRDHTIDNFVQGCGCINSLPGAIGLLPVATHCLNRENDCFVHFHSYGAFLTRNYSSATVYLSRYRSSCFCCGTRKMKAFRADFLGTRFIAQSLLVSITCRSIDNALRVGRICCASFTPWPPLVHRLGQKCDRQLLALRRVQVIPRFLLVV